MIQSEAHLDIRSHIYTIPIGTLEFRCRLLLWSTEQSIIMLDGLDEDERSVAYVCVEREGVVAERDRETLLLAVYLTAIFIL